MSELTNQYNQSNNEIQPSNNNSVMAQTSSNREIEEVKGQVFMARQFPRDVFQAQKRILDSCKRDSLARTAIYSYPRGGSKVEGPSIRLAEVLAQNWGNISYGVKELEQRNGESVAMAYAWDLETNTRQEKVFTVTHNRYTKANGMTKLTDPRDIYEHVANNGARRMRACILGIIPGDVVEMAVQECNRTLRGENNGPLKDRLAGALKLFKEHNRVTKDQIENYFGYTIDKFSEVDLSEMGKIYNSLKDGITKPDDWFKKPAKNEEKSRLTESFEKKEKEEKENIESQVKEMADDAEQIEIDESELPFN